MKVREIVEGALVMILLLALAFVLTLGFREMLGGGDRECSCEMVKNKECQTK